jgi:hypothetical protein
MFSFKFIQSEVNKIIISFVFRNACLTFVLLESFSIVMKTQFDAFFDLTCVECFKAFILNGKRKDQQIIFTEEIKFINIFDVLMNKNYSCFPCLNKLAEHFS